MNAVPARFVDYQGHYSAPRFWAKLGKRARAAGHELVEKALWLYYAAQRPETPGWAKATVYGALAYFILPADAIPDLAPVVGFVDDLAALSVAVLTIAAYIDERVKKRARETLQGWFDW